MPEFKKDPDPKSTVKSFVAVRISTLGVLQQRASHLSHCNTGFFKYFADFVA